MKATLKIPLAFAAADIELHYEQGLPANVSGRVYHSSKDDGPCRAA